VPIEQCLMSEVRRDFYSISLKYVTILTTPKPFDIQEYYQNPSQTPLLKDLPRVPASGKSHHEYMYDMNAMPKPNSFQSHSTFNQGASCFCAVQLSLVFVNISSSQDI